MINAFEKVIEFEKNGFTKAQGETIVKVSMDIMNQEFATKHDLFATKSELKSEIQQVRSELKSEIQQVRSELKSEIQQVRSELKSEIQELRSELNALGDRLTIRLGGMMTAGLAIIFGMLQMMK